VQDEIPEFKPLIFSCSGSADVGGIGDGSARRLDKEGVAKMFCLAGVGAKIEQILTHAELAEMLISVDGCENECSRKVLQAAGFHPAIHLRITDLGMEKGNTPISPDRIREVSDEIKRKLREKNEEKDS
jgi:uncharacterized metal-binding protein